MKKLFLSIILSLAVLPFFALGLQHDAFVGESDGLDTAILFGQNKIKNYAKNLLTIFFPCAIIYLSKGETPRRRGD